MAKQLVFLDETFGLDEEDTEDTHKEQISSECLTNCSIKTCDNDEVLRLKGGHVENQSRRILEREARPICNES